MGPGQAFFYVVPGSASKKSVTYIPLAPQGGELPFQSPSETPLFGPPLVHLYLRAGLLGDTLWCLNYMGILAKPSNSVLSFCAWGTSLACHPRDGKTFAGLFIKEQKVVIFNLATQTSLR
jgi:hypothetical protein